MKKENVIWGAGMFGSRLLMAMGEENISFFIDSNIKKSNQILSGKKIYHPSSIKNWKELYIYVPYHYYDEIKELLINKGLCENDDFIKYESKCTVPYDIVRKNYIECINILNNLDNQYKGATLFWGGAWLTGSAYNSLARRIKQSVDNKYIFLSEDGNYERLDEDRNNKVLAAPMVCSERLSFRADGQDCSESRYEERKNELFEKCLAQMKVSAEYQDDLSARQAMDMMYTFFAKLLDKISPRIVFTFACIYVSSMILDMLCKEKNVPVIYCHEGILPGTMCCDIDGEVGKSLPAVYDKKFKNLAITAKEKEDARNVWNYLYQSKLNRKVQPQNDVIQSIRQYIDKQKPTVLFLGQNDPLSHMIPYTDETRRYHSPIFESSLDAAVYLGKICERNHWNFVYKPHPNFVVADVKEILPKSTIYVEFCDINNLIDLSDVVVTILSTSCYNALTRYKPVVMLGYTQTRGQGCTYEAFELEKIEERIKEALTDGFSDEMQQRFVEHIARLNKYYLYDDMTERELRYGKTVPNQYSEFFALKNLLAT